VANKYQIIAEDKRVIEKRLNTDAYSQKKGGSVLLFGGAGSGKSANIILPTIYRSLENDVKPSLIVTDPKGELHSDTYKFAEKNGYLVINFSKTGDT
jgi:type IV secretory pathway TraG/TraD family ATPase VirD4